MPNASVKQLAEGLAAYLGWVLQRAVPTAEWMLQSTGFGLAPAIHGFPDDREPAAVTKVAVDYTIAALRPLTDEQERLFRRYQPLRADVDRWLRGLPSPPVGESRRRWRFRRG